MPHLTPDLETPFTADRLQSVLTRLKTVLRDEMTPAGHWDGYLSSSALSTAVAAFALSRFDPEAHRRQIARGRDWLIANQNSDGSWGDTTDSPGNLATTLLSLAALEGVDGSKITHCRQTARDWLANQFGSDDPETLHAAVIAFYGGDRTFSAPILALCTAAGIFGEPNHAAWARVPQLPFELSVMPHQLWPHLRLAVVSYAIPALITIGLVRHRLGGTRWCPLYRMRDLTVSSALKILHRAQPASGGYLEAAPLTGFCTMALSVAGLRAHPVAVNGARFLRENQRDDGSWPIDTNLATWLSTLSIKALDSKDLSTDQRRTLLEWLLDQQHLDEHPFTHAAPGGFAWTNLSGGVPDGDDTAGALLALRKLSGDLTSDRIRRSASKAIRWLADLQNADGGIPTFCRGWGKLPFDQSCPDITAHAIRAWTAWQPVLPQAVPARALDRALAYMQNSQRPDGSWIPRWFGSQHVESHENPVFGTAQALISLAEANNPRLTKNVQRGKEFLLKTQNPDGSWGAAHHLRPSIEETALSLSALCALATNGSDDPQTQQARQNAATWLTAVCENALTQDKPLPAAPIGLYFASLWYHERLYPMIFATEALSRFSGSSNFQFSNSKQFSNSNDQMP